MNPQIEELRQQGKQFLSALRDKRAITRGFIKESAPRVVRGFILEELHEKSNAEVYQFLSGDMWAPVKEKYGAFLEAYKPWPLEWLTVEWVQQTVAATHPAIALAISDSEQLRSSIQSTLDAVRQELS